MCELTAAVEALAPNLKLQQPAFASFLTRALDSDAPEPSGGLFELYFKKLARTNFSQLIFWASRENLQLLEGSPEHYLARRSRFWYDSDYEKIRSNVPRDLLQGFERDRFVRAAQLISTR